MRRALLSRLLWIALAGVPVSALAAQFAFADAWWTPDQQAARLYRAGKPDEAAALFRDPTWRAAALFAAGRFEDAAAVWSGVPGAEAAYDRGNALVLLGRYAQAVESYERALSLRPGWPAAAENRDIARSRIRTETALGEKTELGADDVVFDENMDTRSRDQADPVEATGGEALSDDALRALWLRNVQTEPADFLRVKFAYQQAVQATADGGEGAR